MLPFRLLKGSRGRVFAEGGIMPYGKSILFVDDEEEILELLTELFAEDGYDLYTAREAEEAIKIVDRNSVDFVLSDLKLPDASGLELLEMVRQRNPRTVRVLTSGYLDVKFGSVKENSVDGTLYLSKPWDLFVLKQLVSERLG